MKKSIVESGLFCYNKKKLIDLDVYLVKYGVWNISACAPEALRRLEEAGYTALTARVLASRGIETAQDAARYLASDDPLLNPFLMRDLKKAADRVRLAVARREHIAVFGDYDVDGITSTCLLVDFLRDMGARVTPYIPSRLEEGYGLNPIAIETLYRKQVDLIVTVDCGITANDEALLCKKLGMELVITDHHECKDELPYAVAVVDPHRKDRTYPHTDLSGVGIAFKLAAAICGDQEAVLARYADLLCLGLIADVMPLRGEVRTMVVRGLKALNEARRPGVEALLREAGCVGKSVTAATVGYTLAPRINAAGRMGQVELAVKLFLTQDPSEASSYAAALCRLNKDRQRVEAGIYQEATALLAENPQKDAIVLTGETWHQGVVGIVASRLSEEYGCPTFLICMDGDKGKASSRSYGSFNLFSSLTQLSALLESYGGHELAAGFTIRRENIPRFREQICALVRQYNQQAQAEDALRVDCAVSPELLTVANIEQLQQLEPCGVGCPGPVFCTEDLIIEHLTEVGGGKHLRLRLRSVSKPGVCLSGIFFSNDAAQAGVAAGDRVDVAYVPQVNEYRGVRSAQLSLADIRPCRAVREEARRQQELYERFRDNKGVSPGEAEQLLPVRAEFIAVWRYLVAHCPAEGMRSEFVSLCREINRSDSIPVSMAKVRICLDVFDELSLLSLRRQTGALRIQLTNDGKKVDLNKSRTVQALRTHRAGE